MPNRPVRRHGSSVRAADDRPSAARRGYGRRWRRLRLSYLNRHPICENPFGIQDHLIAATDVDHIIARRFGGPDRDDNLQALCHACHSRKTRLEQTGKLTVTWTGPTSVQDVLKFLREGG